MTDASNPYDPYSGRSTPEQLRARMTEQARRAQWATEALGEMSVLFPERRETYTASINEIGRVRTIEHNNQIIEEIFCGHNHYPQSRITQTFHKAEHGWQTEITKETLRFSPEVGHLVINIAQRSIPRLPTELVNKLCWRQEWTIDNNIVQCTFLANRAQINPLLKLNFRCDRFHASYRESPMHPFAVDVELHLSSPQAHLARDRRGVEMLDGVRLFGDSGEGFLGDIAGGQRFALRLPDCSYERTAVLDNPLPVLDNPLGERSQTGHRHYRHTFRVSNPTSSRSNIPLPDTRDFRENPLGEMRSVGSGAPKICRGCQNFCGKTFGGNQLICAIHPYGNGEECADFQTK